MDDCFFEYLPYSPIGRKANEIKKENKPGTDNDLILKSIFYSFRKD